MPSLDTEALAEVARDHWWFQVRRRVVADVARALFDDDEHIRVVDVGCGTSGNAADLAGPRCAVLGVDVSPETIEVARRHFPQAEFRATGPGLEDVIDDVADADLLLLMDVLEHVPDDHWFLSSLTAALRPGAHVLVTVPADEQLWSSHDVASLHWRRYSPERLRRVFAGLPLDIRVFGPLNRHLYHPIRAVRGVKRRLGRESGQGECDVVLPSPMVNRVLEAVFDSERRRLRAALDGTAELPRRRGVSLIGVATRLEGPCEVRTRPADEEPDLHDPTLDSP